MKYQWLAVASLAAFVSSGCGSQLDAWQAPTCCGGEFGERIRVMTLNIAHGRGTAFHQALVPSSLVRRNLARIAEVAVDEDVELAGFQEADHSGLDGFNHIATIAELGGFEWWVSGAHARLGSLEYGTALAGRSPLPASETFGFDTFGPGFKKGYSVSTIQMADREVDVVSLHLDPLLGIRRKQQVEQIAEHLADRERPVVVMGDFNTDWGEKKAVTKLADELGLRAYQPNSTDLDTFGKRRLDWILVSEDDLDFDDYRTLPYEVSDHRGVLAEIVLR